MNPSPRATAVRLVIWCLLFGWAVWKMRSNADVAAGANMALAPAMRVLERPTDVPVDSRDAGDAVIDPEALQSGLQIAAKAAKACGAHGAVLTVTVGRAGLLRAELRGQVPDDAAHIDW